MKNAVLNKKVLIRSVNSGVHYGTLVDWDGHSTLMLRDTRRLWEWHTGGAGVSLSEIAVCGIDQSRSKITVTLPELIVTDAIEIIPCYGLSIATIEGAEVYKP